jgi:outer membrane immunogenic protein
MKIRTALLTSAFALLASCNAFAADMGAPGPAYPAYKAPPPAPYASWTGYYFGGNIGYSWGRSENDVGITGLPGTLFGISTASLARGDRDHQDVDGVIGGFQSGYNWQVGNWVMGMESDLQASGQKSDTRYCNLGGTSCAIASLDASHKLAWFGTARSRIGMLVTPSTLLYATAGVAYGQVKTDYALSLLNTSFATANFKDVKAGWTAGAGLEFALAGNWSTKLEYLYMDLGKSEMAVSVGGINASLERHFTDHIARLGINYRFGGAGPAY